MITWTRRHRGRKREPDLAWIDMDAADTAHHPTALTDIAARRLDGITVSGVFTAEEAARAVTRLEARPEDRSPAIFGTMLGMSLANVAVRSPDPDDRSIYFDEAEAIGSRYLEAFGFDPFTRLASVLAPMAGGRVLAPPSEAGRPYLAGNIRWMEPDGRGLPAHVGNEFLVQGDRASEHLRSVTKIRDHYSWFVVLQAPDDGGALSVYDLLYEDDAAAGGQWGETGRDDADFDLLPAKRIAPAAGTLVLFGGGWRWHRVDRVRGARPRVTYGGFAGPSTDGSALHFWF